MITPSVRLCVQHDAREAARRAGPSAAADSGVATWERMSDDEMNANTLI